MSDDQRPFIKNIPDYMKSPPMVVTVLDADQKKICEYRALPGLELEKYVEGPGTYTTTQKNGDKSVTVFVRSKKTNRTIQVHIGVYQW